MWYEPKENLASVKISGSWKRRTKRQHKLEVANRVEKGVVK